MPRRQRLDTELVRRAMVSSRSEACELIDVGRVLVNGSIAMKASHQIDPADALIITGPPARFVSRGGEKLEAALEACDLDVKGRRILDAGASTGGFTDCLLQRGAAFVVALDVGHGQLHPKIRGDERVQVIEKFNVRRMLPADIGGMVSFVVADLSFISLTLVIPALIGVCEPGSDMVLLVKPQFEVGRRDVSRGRGIISDPRLQHMACEGVRHSCLEAGADVQSLLESPITGAEGNKEFLLHATVRAKM